LILNETRIVKLVEINWNPTDRQLRQFGAISTVLLPIVGLSWGASPVYSWALAGLGATLAVVGWFYPRALKHLFVALTVATIPIGRVVGELAMLAIYLVVFLPIGLAFRLMRRDGLQLKFDRQAATYWQPKKQAAGVAGYYRQS
jgi:hypothetical protein